MKTTLSVGAGADTVSLAGSQHDILAETRWVVVIHSMSAGVTSDRSQPEWPGRGGGLLSAGDEVVVMLEEAIGLARICRDSRCPMMLSLTEREEGGS
jgi:hypothetical protein